MYSHLGMKGKFHYWQTQAAHYCHTRTGHPLRHTGVSLPGSKGEGHDDALNSGARRGQTKLYSSVIHQVELHISISVIAIVCY